VLGGLDVLNEGLSVRLGVGVAVPLRGDVANGVPALHYFADLNPFRWSGSRSIPQAIEELREVQRHEQRPIIVRKLYSRLRIRTCESMMFLASLTFTIHRGEYYIARSGVKNNIEILGWIPHGNSTVIFGDMKVPVRH